METSQTSTNITHSFWGKPQNQQTLPTYVSNSPLRATRQSSTPPSTAIPSTSGLDLRKTPMTAKRSKTPTTPTEHIELPPLPRSHYHPWTITPESPMGLYHARYNDMSFFFAGSFLLLGDGYITNVVRLVAHTRTYAATIHINPFYVPHLRITVLYEMLVKLPCLPPRIMLSVGNRDTLVEEEQPVNTVISDFRRLLRLLRSMGVQQLIMLLNIVYEGMSTLRSEFNELLATANANVSDIRYVYRSDVASILDVGPPSSTAMGYFDHRPSENRKIAYFFRCAALQHYHQ